MVKLGENLHHPPLIKDDVLQLGLGKSIVILAQASRMIRLPFTINQTLEFKDVGNLPRGIQFQGG